MHTQRPAPPLPLRAFGLLTAISSALKSSPRGGQSEGDDVSPEPRDSSLPTRPPGALRLKKLKSPGSREE